MPLGFGAAAGLDVGLHIRFGIDQQRRLQATVGFNPRFGRRAQALFSAGARAGGHGCQRFAQRPRLGGAFEFRLRHQPQAHGIGRRTVGGAARVGYFEAGLLFTREAARFLGGGCFGARTGDRGLLQGTFGGRASGRPLARFTLAALTKVRAFAGCMLGQDAPARRFGQAGLAQRAFLGLFECILLARLALDRGDARSRRFAHRGID